MAHHTFSVLVLVAESYYWIYRSSIFIFLIHAYFQNNASISQMTTANLKKNNATYFSVNWYVICLIIAFTKIEVYFYLDLTEKKKWIKNCKTIIFKFCCVLRSIISTWVDSY